MVVNLITLIFTKVLHRVSLVPAPSHGEEGSGTMSITNLFYWNAEVTCINLFVVCNYHIRFKFCTHESAIGMATSTETYCLGCGDDISHRVHDKRYSRLVMESLLKPKLALMARH